MMSIIDRDLGLTPLEAPFLHHPAQDRRLADLLRPVVCALLLFPLQMRCAAEGDPFPEGLDLHAPEILRQVPTEVQIPENVTVQGVVFRSREESEIYALIAKPKAPGQHPGILVLHGGGGSAEVEKAIAWAQRGYVAVAPDLPGIANPKKLTITKSRWSETKYGDGRYVAQPDASASVLVDAVLSAMRSLALLRAQPEVDPARLGVVGISWGGYMTTMVCALAGDRVRAGFSVYGCGFYELTPQQKQLILLPEEERARWMEFLDAGRRAPRIRAPFFIAGAANDFFYWPRAVQATLDAIPGEKNHLFSPNESHRVSLPGGTVFPKASAEPFTPTPFQPYATPSGNKANWLAMEVPYFDYYLNGVGRPFPVIQLERSTDPLRPRFKTTAPHPITKAEIYWSSSKDEDWGKRPWTAVPASADPAGVYEAEIVVEPQDGAKPTNIAWFAVVSDDRPVSVSSDLVLLAP